MKGLIRLIVIAVVFSGCMSSQDTLIDTRPLDKSLPVDTLISIKYTITSERHAFKADDRSNNKKYLEETEGYDNDKLVERISYSPDGKIEQHCVFTYKNGLLQDEYILNNPIGPILNKTSYFYKPDRQLIATVYSNFQRRVKEDTTGQWRCMIFDSDIETTKSWGDLITTDYVYDSNKRLTKEIKTTEGLIEEDDYSYNANGFITNQVTLRSGTLLREIATRYYKNMEESVCLFYPDKSGNICKKTFDENKHLLVEECTENYGGKPMYIRRYFYDPQFRVSREDYVTNLGTTISTQYVYKTLDKPVVKEFVVDNK